jgi:hypothetical protein
VTHTQHRQSPIHLSVSYHGYILGFSVATLSACATLRGGGGSCQPSSASAALAPFAPADALAFVGDYELTIVAESGPRPGHSARGSMSIAPNDTLHRYYINAQGQGWRRRGDRPLIGWGQVDGDVGLMTAGTPIESRDPAEPGIVFRLDSVGGGFRFMLGYRPMHDGGYNQFIVTDTTDTGFAGRWHSSLGPTTYRASGFFCAQRIGAH